jgi:5-methylcytosine-specific restriction endonuclease McrA
MKVNAKKIFERDQWVCQLCGQTFTDGSLVPHHRANRGMGGSVEADKPSNVISLCSLCNGVIESDPEKAQEARRRGVKVSKYDTRRTHDLPLYGHYNGKTEWVFILDNYEVKSTTQHTKLEFIEGTC